jgi:twitching motility protein PilT
MVDKRKTQRIPVSIRIKYHINGDPEEKTFESFAGNIGEGGLYLVYNKEPIPAGTLLDLLIQGMHHDNPITAKARVVWIREVKENKMYEVGVSFTDIRDKDLSLIKQWVQTIDLDQILSIAVKNGASDIHLVAGQPPTMRVHGDLRPVTPKMLSAEEIKSLIQSFMTPQQKEKFEAEMELDISYVCDIGRFRVNIHQEKGQMGVALRYIPTEIKSFVDLNLPLILEELAHKPNGLILITGPNGCGKSTTVAAIIETINKQRKCTIMSLEEPIEYIFKSKKSIIEQREIGFDALSFQSALRYIVRQDLNVIYIGEIRDLNSISVALTAAEAGHLVLTTLHTNDAVSSVNRIIDAFPHQQQQQVRMQLAECLRGVCSQILLPKKEGEGRIVATEVLVCNNAVSNLIRRGSINDIRGIIETGSRFGMHSLQQSLEELYSKGLVPRESILSYVSDISKFL